MQFRGRRKILTNHNSGSIITESDIASIINSTITRHRANKSEIDYLINYWKGNQPILAKTKLVREEINNIMVVNHAQRITRTIVGYFLGNPIQYIQSGSDKKEEIDELNQVLSYEDKSTVDTEIGEFQSVCGTAYRVIYRDGIDSDEVPFENKALNPSTTYVVYENSISEKPVVGITYHTILDSDGNDDGVKYYAYVRNGLYTIETSDGTVDIDSIINFTPYNVGGIPIIEYPNNPTRMGDWEFVLCVMDAINDLQSGRLDDIDQIVESLLVFINAEIDSETYSEMREQGVVLLKNTINSKTDVKSISNPLDQIGMNIFAKELENLLDVLVGIPSRDTRGGGGGDTGQAVELRDGWADLEIVARNKESVFKKSEKQALKIILNIMRTTENITLTLRDVDIKFTRNKNHNLLVKTQSLQTLLSTRILSAGDCLTIVDLVSDVNEYITRGESYWTPENLAKYGSVASTDNSNTTITE